MARTAHGIGMGLLFTVGALLAQQGSAQDGLPEPIVSERLSKPLADIPGKEVLVLTVEYPPGGGDPIHRHDAHGFIYVLEGEIVMGVRGGKAVTLRRGDTFYEGPDDIHTVGRNASKTERARFLAVLVKNTGAGALIPLNQGGTEVDKP
ncbi:MAG: cupin domain-containing protein [Limnobacter sp.]|nr:cupin domain-containing protein [Limnobacter sp.]